MPGDRSPAARLTRPCNVLSRAVLSAARATVRAPRAEEEAGFDCVIELVVACRQVSSGRAPAESAVRRRSRGDEKTPYRRMHLARAAQGVDVRVARGPRKAQESTWISRDGAAHGGKPAHGAARQRRRRTFRFQLRWRTLHQVQGCCGAACVALRDSDS